MSTSSAAPLPCSLPCSLPPLTIPFHLGASSESFIKHVRALSSPPIPLTDDEASAEGWSLHTVYGELCPRSVAALLSIAVSACTSSTTNKSNLTFVDLGSGEGIPALLARSLFPTNFALARGVELLPRVHRVACALAAASRAALEVEVAAEGSVKEEETAEHDTASGCAAASVTSDTLTNTAASSSNSDNTLANSASGATSSSTLANSASATSSSTLANSASGATSSSTLANSASGATSSPFSFSVTLQSWSRQPPPTSTAWHSSTIAGAARDEGAGLELLCDDFLDGNSNATNWPTTADVIFFNGTCYGIDFLERVWRAAEKLRPGAILIVTTHEMPGRLFELVAAGSVAASWGSATARVYRRLPLPRWIAGVVGRHSRAPSAVK
jgi:hypothetical protein